MPSKKARKPLVNHSFPFSFTWMYGHAIFRSSVLPVPCAFCQAVAVVELPDPLKEIQDDGTTHVCHPTAGGCNHGFASENG